ncbi:hypothetical protein CsatB_009404 [Cannabis sativa]
MIPGALPTHVEEEGKLQAVTELKAQNSEEGDKIVRFSPGSNEGNLQKRKRGRPRKGSDPCLTPSASSKRGRTPVSLERIGVNSKSLKKKRRESSFKGNSSHYQNLWNANGIDLTIDLDNHFVLVEKSKEKQPRCEITELLVGGDQTQKVIEDGEEVTQTIKN